MGKDTFMVSRTNNSPLATNAELKMAALNDAQDHCQKTGMTYAVVGGYDVPRSLGTYPQTEIHFRCVPK
jgi:hypothetical protein